MSDYIEKVVLRLKREYSKDELVAHLSKKLTEAEMEIGILKSEKEEALYNLDKMLNADPEVKARLKKMKKYKQLWSRIRDLQEKCLKLKTDNDKLIMKVVKLNKNKITTLPRIDILKKSA